MATTLEQLETGSASIEVVVAIEGLDYLLCTGPTADVLTAWAATEWTQAINGLQVNWGLKQRLDPWSAFADDSSVSLSVQADENDTIGQLMFATTSGAETLLTDDLDCSQRTVTVKSTADFASSGSIHIGTEHITYTSKTATQFLGCNRGMYSPFRGGVAPIRRVVGAETKRFGRAHPLPAIGDGYVVPPRVTSQPRSWVGRMVGVWIHARRGATLDTLPNAQLVFAGRIAEFRDDTNGLTRIEVENYLGAIKNSVLLADQWTARVRNGISLRAGEKFRAFDNLGTTASALLANNLEVVASGATGNNQLNAGVYSLHEIADAVNTWLAAEKAAARLNLRCSFTPEITIDGAPRSAFFWSGGPATTSGFGNFEAPPDVLEFMGFIGQEGSDETDRVVQASRVSCFVVQQARLVSNATPMVVFIRAGSDHIIPLEDVRGTWFDNREFLAGYGIPRTSTESYALIKMGDDSSSLMLCIEDVPGESIRVFQPGADLILNGQSATADPLASIRKIYVGSGSEDIPLKQVAHVTGDFGQLLTTFLASTGTRGYNHGEYDKLPAQLSVAVPWQLLESAWLNSAEHVAESGADLIVRIDKPTKFSELFLGDLASRLAFFRWKNEHLQLATWSVPAVAIASKSLTEANKAEPSDTNGEHRSIAIEDDAYLVNAIKLQYARNEGDQYTGTINIIDKSSQYDTGVYRPVTLSLRNLNGDGASASARKIADGLAAMMGILAHPLRVVRRSIAPELYENLAPGDIVLLTDDFIRDPSTGTRGITNRAALVIGHECDYGGYEIDTARVRPPYGQVDLLLWPREKVVAHSPTAQVRDTAANGGYNAGTQTITVNEHEHSLATDAADITAFDDDDAVTIIEIDPDDPATAQSWTTTITARDSGTHEVTLADALTGWDSTKRYRMIPANYASATTTQQAKAFQATTDHMIVDAATAFEYGVNAEPAEGFRDTGNELPALYATDAFGDGAAFDVGYERDAARLANNLLRWRTAPFMPALTDTVKVADDIDIPSGTLIRGLLAIEPVVFPASLSGPNAQLIAVRAWARSSSGRSSLRVTLARRQPYGSGFYLVDENNPVYGWERPAQTEEVALTSTTWGATQLMLFEHTICDPVEGDAFFIIEGGPHAEYQGLCLCQLIPGDARVPPLSWAPVGNLQPMRRKRSAPLGPSLFYVRV